MDIVNGSKHVSVEVSTALDVEGREHLIIVAKATYGIPANDGAATPIKSQPFVMADIYAGEPGLSAALYEADFVLRKQRCDVLFNANAYASGLSPVTQLDVRVQVGAMNKTLRVFGDRFWEKRLTGIKPGKPAPITRVPLHYGKAYGGVQVVEGDSGTQSFTHRGNPIGIGYGPSSKEMVGVPMPNIESVDDPVQSPKKDYPPRALSAISRSDPKRAAYAGTYDERWRRDVFPFLPGDFDDRYYQCAPEDQQIEFPRGGETVELLNLMQGRPHVRFKLPKLSQMPVRILGTDYQVHEPEVHVDTLYFEPDEGRFSVVWRTSIPLQRRIQEIDTVAVGPICKNWWMAKIGGAAGCTGCGGKRSTKSAPDDCEDEITLVEKL